MRAWLVEGAEKEAHFKPRPEYLVHWCVYYLESDKIHKHTHTHSRTARIKPAVKTQIQTITNPRKDKKKKMNAESREQLQATNYQLHLEGGLKALSSPFWQETLRWCGKWVKAHP